MRSRIGTQAIVWVGLVTAVVVGLMTIAVVRTHREALVAELRQSASQLSATIKNSTHEDMLENRRDSLRRQIETIGGQQGIAGVRLFNKEGRVAFASDPREVGSRLDIRAEACRACHTGQTPSQRLAIAERSRIFRGPDGTRVLGIIEPIENLPSCATAACHAHPSSERVLGVLDVGVSLAGVDRTIAVSQAQMAGVAAMAVTASSLILWLLHRRLVVRPVQRLVAATRRVAEGDLATAVPVAARDELGDLARAFNDMTRRLADAQRQIAQADRLASLGRLAAGVAHEINNPLTGVLTYASFLEKRAGADTRDDLEVIVRETKRCREIVKNLLDFARQTPPRRQPSDVNEVVKRAVTILMNQLALRRVSLDLDLASDLPQVPLDASQIQQVLVNLLVNAADATGDNGGRLQVATRQVQLPPRGHTPIRSASCPAGCNLLDAGVRLGGLPAIHVKRTCGGHESAMHLDPVYGRFNNVSAEACPDGAVADYACPRCRVSLAVQAVCASCGGPTFGVRSGTGVVLFCRRNGCHGSQWDEAEARGARQVVEIVVADSGRGISRSDLPHLFEPFFTTKGTRGTGLGLAVSWGIVDGHGGAIDVASEEGKGSRFSVRLPVVPVDDAQGRAA